MGRSRRSLSGAGVGPAWIANPLSGERFWWERSKPRTWELPPGGNVGLDKLIRRFNVQRTGLTLVNLFNVAP